jgi:hypothetical protein
MIDRRSRVITKLGRFRRRFVDRRAMAAIRRDKKVVHGKLHFVLATSISTTETVERQRRRLRGALPPRPPLTLNPAGLWPGP